MSADKDTPRFIADECVGTSTVLFLKSFLGSAVVRAQEIGLRGKSDPEIVQWAATNNHIIISEDKGLANILKYPPQSHRGIIVLRIRRKSKPEVHQTLKEVLTRLSLAELTNSLIIVEAGEYRIRRG